MNSTFYVAMDGNDAWSGKLAEPNADKTDGPFATLARARDAVRELKAREKKPLTVMVRGGKYFLAKPLVFGPEDSGTKTCPVTYAAYPGEKPIISGGRKITGFKPYKDKILQCELPGAKGGKWKFRQLFFNGERQIRARYPKFDPQDPLYGGYACIEGPAEGEAYRGTTWDGEGSTTTFTYQEGTFRHRWAKPTEGEVFIWPYHDWGDTRIIPIESVDHDRRIIRMAHGIRNFDCAPHFNKISLTPGNRFYVENLLEELDQPGEWCLDSEEGVLYFWPPAASETCPTKPPGRSRVADAEVVAPVLSRLIDLRGASYITISGFTFAETRGGDNAHPHTVQGVGAMFPETGLTYCGEAVHLQKAERCTVENNHFHAVGGNGIYLELCNHRNIIRHNEISHPGANGVVLAGAKGLVQTENPGHPFYNEITDNHIHHCGLFDKWAAGVFLGRSTGNIIAHNLIHDLPHHGINLGSDGYSRNFVEYNRIERVCLETRNTGAINTWNWGQPEQAGWFGHIIRYNYIANCGKPGQTEAGVRGIYLDGESSNCFVYGNILAHNPVGVMMHGGKNNIVENNIIVGGVAQAQFVNGLITGAFEFFFSGHRFSRNILYGTAAECPLYQARTREVLSRALAQCDYNLIFNAANEDGLVVEVYERQPKGSFNTVPLSEWQEDLGFDEHSVIADPLFVDEDNGDYRLKAESPAFKLGFQPIDISRIGPRKE